MKLRPLIGAAVARLPEPQRRRVDALYGRLYPGWVYNADGLATVHHSPFLEDPEFDRRYWQMAERWYQDEMLDARWRMWILTRYALQAARLPGDFAEFGVYRGGCAWMVLSTVDLDPSRRLDLFDTFAGIPDDKLTAAEQEAELGGKLTDTSSDYVAKLLAPWDPIPRLWPGDVFDTLPGADIGELAFVHVDLNAAAPTLHVLNSVMDRVVPGGFVVLDDYVYLGYEDQRRAIDEAMRDRPEVVVALPTGQGVITKLPG